MITKDKRTVSNKFNIGSLIFLAKSETDVIKVAKCTYANDVKDKAKYFLCSCSAEDFYPICEGCAAKCHKHHSPALELEGIYTCMCGKTNHLINQENEKRFTDKKLKLLNQCFFTKFMEITPNRGIHRFNNLTVCSICLEYCHGKNIGNPEVETMPDDDQYICKCPKHYEVNVINLNVDLISKPKFHFHLQNFNFNILSKIASSRQIYLDYFVAKIDEYIANMNEENSKNFFTNFINFKILELFSTFAVRWENKFFHVKNYLDTRKPADIIELLRFKEPLSIIEPNKAADFVNSKFYFAEFLFNYLVRTYQLKNNNLWNIRTIINMNLYQRLVYLHRIKDFSHFNFFEEKKNNEDYQNIQILTNTILDLYEGTLKMNETYDCKDKIIRYVFPTFNRIFKYLIKYNIIDDSHKTRYFESVLDTINIANEAGYDHYQGSELYIIKSILYCLIYRNDHICLEYLAKGELGGKFVLCAGMESDTMSKVFINTVNKYQREEDLSKTIIYDYYVRKILEIMIGKNEFYVKNLENLKYIPDYKMNLLIEPDKINNFVFNRVDKNYMSQIVKFSSKLNMINREYFDYNINYETYLNQVNDIFRDFKNFFYNEVCFLPDLTKKYQIFLDKYDANDDTINRVLDLQTSVPYTLFFQKLEEFLHILSEGKKYLKKSNFNISGVQNDYLKVLLHFLFLLVNKNLENVCLLMNIKPLVFVNAFIYVQDDLFNFMDVISEFLFSNYYQYKFDNYYFFTEVINAILENFDIGNNLLKNIKLISILGRVMKLSEKSVRFISMDQPDGLNCIERIIERLKTIQNDATLLDLLHDYFNNGNGKNYKDLTANETADIERFLINYFSFLNELKFNDIFFLGLIKDSDLLFNLQTIKVVAEKILNTKHSENLRFNVELEYNVIKFFLQMSICHNLKIHDNKNYLTNLYMKDIPKNVESTSIRFLSRNPQITHYSDTDSILKNTEFMLKNMRIFPELFEKFSNNKNLNLIEKKVSLLNLFEHLILRPTYNLLNIYISDNSAIKGKQSFYIFQIIYYFLFNTVFLYENMSRLFNFNNEENKKKEKEINLKLKDEEIKLLQKIEILEYEDICVKGELDLILINEIKKDAESMYKNEIKYFELELIYNKFINTCEKIVKYKTKSEDLDINQVYYDKTEAFDSFGTKSKKKFSLAKTRINSLIELYKDKVNSTYDDSLALINVLDKMENNLEIDIASELLYYILMKLSDNLTDENIKNFDNSIKDNYTHKNKVKTKYILGTSYKRAQVKDLNISNFKFQNTYCLVFLNLLFFHDSGRFQGILAENFQDDYDYFFTFITLNLISPSIIREADKNYQLDKLNCSKKSLPYDIAFSSIKLLQNLCENHNQDFQKKFFNHDFRNDINVQVYPYIVENFDENINKNDGIKKKNLLNMFKNFIKKSNLDEIADDKLNNSQEENDKMEETKKKVDGLDEIQSKNPKLSATKKLNNFGGILDSTTLNNKTQDNKSPLISIVNTNILEKGNNVNHLPINSETGEVCTTSIPKRANESNYTLIKKKDDRKQKILDLKKKEKIKEENELKNLQLKRLSFFNFIGHNERIIIRNLNLDENSLLNHNKKFKNYEHILYLYQRLSELIIEMIQGTSNKNFENFYKNLPDNLNIFDKNRGIKNFQTLDYFIYILKAFDVQTLLFDQKPFERISVYIKSDLFLTINNVVNQELSDKSIVTILSIIFPSEKIIELISKYVRGLYVKHILQCDYEDKNFSSKFEDLELDKISFDDLIYSFKANNDIYEDEFFKLSSQMFLFLTILGEKYEFADATKILGYKNLELLKHNEEFQEVEKPALYKRFFSVIKSAIKKKFNRNLGYEELDEEKIYNKKTYLNFNNYIITSKFLGKIIYSCEFMIDSSNDEGSDLILKKIYFIIDPRAYLVSKNNIENFFGNVDRSSSTNKIKSLIDELSFFQSEVEYKEKFLKDNSKHLKWLLEIEYKQVDFINFCVSLVINIILLIFLRGGDSHSEEFLNYLIFILGFSTICVNIVYLILFILSKYRFYINIELSKLENPNEINILEKFKIYFVNSFLTNEEIYLMILNSLIGTIGILSRKATFLFSLQLLTVIKFVPTIKEIVLAFKLRFVQLISMIAFLGILIFFYSIVGFYFFNDEFVKDLSSGEKGNICMNLMECWITYFNIGVRSGGGIGDLLDPKPFRETGIYWIRYVMDMIFFVTVILLLLNMINGVIVSTFSQIREESNEKDEDINNKCFICNIDRMEFEKRKILFKSHLKYEHNSKNYIKFLIYLNLIHEKDLDADQSFILSCIKKRDVYCFPVGKCTSIGEIKEEEAEDDANEENAEEEDIETEEVQD